MPTFFRFHRPNGTLTCLLTVLLTFGAAGCLKNSQPKDSSPPPLEPEPISAPDDAKPQRIVGILHQTLEKAQLTPLWTTELPLGRAISLKCIFYHQKTLYALYSNNLLCALDSQTGIIKWSTYLGRDHTACSTMSPYQDHMLFVLAHSIVEVRQSDGVITHQLDLNIPVSTNAVRTADRLFVGGLDNRFYCLRYTDGIVLWQTVCPDQPIGDIALGPKNVYFTCRDGSIFASALEKRQLLWHYQSAGIPAGVRNHAGQCLLPSADTALYCFDPNTGSISWKYLAGGALTDLPALTDSAVYQPVNQTSLLCLNRANDAPQRLRWELPNGRSLLAENGPVTYALTFANELTVMDNNSGKRILSFALPALDLFAVNQEDNLIFLANKSGTLLTLKPKP